MGTLVQIAVASKRKSILQRDCSLKEYNALVDGFSTYRTLFHSVAAHLAGAVATEEDEILPTIHAHRTLGLTSMRFGKEIETQTC